MKRMESRLAHVKQGMKAACILHNGCQSLKDSVASWWESEARAVDIYICGTHSCYAGVQSEGHQALNALANYFWRQAGHTASADVA
ncbi:hypothetical protein HPB48_012478 [Haemaphysalis longicornis]|uniref:Uncharacterized protein n=1 Tax=Haemaphysalis longicornis TaxID=44386 RepID=A0A9J6G766_HAELO|nr:hypothetical protein HPB48_012478 [Haemaphysalis longicornis]